MLDWEVKILKEDCLDENLGMGWSFTQVGRTVAINEAKNEIIWNTINKTRHACNQRGREKGSKKVNDRAKKLWQILLDIQSTCDAIVNPKILVYARRCPWTLTLQKQAGECAIECIGEMKVFGTAWYYSAGVANILS